MVPEIHIARRETAKHPLLMQTNVPPSQLPMELPAAFKILRGTGVPPTSPWRFKPSRPVPMPDKWEKACELIEMSPPKEVLPALASVVWNSETSASLKLEKIFMTHAKSLPLNEWTAFDESVRSYHYDYRDLNWGVLEGSFTRSNAWIIIALCHPSGRTREKALQFVKGLEPRIATALLALRMNDWVDSIRGKASSELDRTLETLAPVDKMIAVPLLIRLRESGRHRQPEKLDAWMGVLASPFDPDAWLEAWTRAHGRNRRGYLEILTRSGHPPDRTLRLVLLTSNDRRALFWLIQFILPGMTGEPRDELLCRIRRSRVPAVKRAWLTQCMEQGTVEEAINVLKESLLDPSRGIRQFAQFHLGKIAPLDFTRFYQNALLDPRTEAAALIGLADISPVEAHSAALRRLDSTVPAIQKAAIRSLSAESIESHFECLLKAISSQVPGVPKIARKRLAGISRFLGTELISQPEIWGASSDKARSVLLSLAPSFQKWDALEFILSRSQEHSSQPSALGALIAWQRIEARTFSRVTLARSVRLKDLLEAGVLPEQMKEHLRFLLKNAE